jgi:hypothetical protein
MAGRSVDGARQYCQVSGVIYLVLTLVGFVSPTTFGLIPSEATTSGCTRSSGACW